MKILALDSTTEACSVALLDSSNSAGQPLESYELAPREHSQRLLPMVDQLLSANGYKLQQMDAIAYGRGPGSFTGLRICLGLVQGLAFGAKLPVVAISSLRALAQTAFDQGLVSADELVIASIDARMDEIYWGGYKVVNGLMQEQIVEQLTAPEHLKLPESQACYVGVGNGFRYQLRINSEAIVRINNQLLPRASALVKLAASDFSKGLACSAAQSQPIYIRDTVTWKKIAEQ